ncbi:MAG: hypothetical protein IJU58_01965 [Clostridia bacterium]|nr:hypothetical protein [Clostridia bacterium]
MAQELDEEYKIIEDQTPNTPQIKLMERSVRKAFVVYKKTDNDAFSFQKYVNISLLDGRYKYKEGHSGEISYTANSAIVDDKGFHKILTCIVEEDFAPHIRLNNFLDLAKTNMTAMVDNRYDIYPEIIIQRDDENEFLLSARVCDDFLFRKVTLDVVDKVSKTFLDDRIAENAKDYCTELKRK